MWCQRLLRKLFGRMHEQLGQLFWELINRLLDFLSPEEGQLWGVLTVRLVSDRVLDFHEVVLSQTQLMEFDIYRLERLRSI